MAARDLSAWIKRADCTRRLQCGSCRKRGRFYLSWQPVEKQEKTRTAHHKRIVAVYSCEWSTRVSLGGPS